MATSAVSSTNFISALGTGSGVDIKALAQSLVDAEKTPKQDIIQRSIDASKARTAGYTTVTYALDQLKAAVDALKDPGSFNAVTPSSSNAQAVSVSANGSGQVGTHEVQVTRLAQAQRVVSTVGFDATDTVATTPYTITMSAGGQTRNVTVNDATPAGLISAINIANFNGITASLLNTGDASDPLRIVVQGKSGADNAFELSGAALAGTGLDATGAALSSGNNRPAQDSELSVNGLTVTRDSNRVSDVIDGVTLDLLRVTSADANPRVNVSLTRDVMPVKEKLRQVVNTYNDLQSILDAAQDKESTVEKLGGSLAGDSTTSQVREQVRQIFMPNVNNLGGSTDPITDLRQLGLFIDSDRKMKFVTITETGSDFSSTFQIGKESAIDKALGQRFEDVAAFFSGTSGAARTISDRLSGSGAYFDTTVRPSSPIKLLKAQTLNAQSRVRADEDRLVALEERMKGLLDRYLRQFAVMDSLVGQSKSVRTGVENSFKGMTYARN